MLVLTIIFKMHKFVIIKQIPKYTSDLSFVQIKPRIFRSSLNTIKIYNSIIKNTVETIFNKTKKFDIGNFNNRNK